MHRGARGLGAGTDQLGARGASETEGLGGICEAEGLGVPQVIPNTLHLTQDPVPVLSSVSSTHQKRIPPPALLDC